MFLSSVLSISPWLFQNFYTLVKFPNHPPAPHFLAYDIISHFTKKIRSLETPTIKSANLLAFLHILSYHQMFTPLLVFVPILSCLPRDLDALLLPLRLSASTFQLNLSSNYLNILKSSQSFCQSIHSNVLLILLCTRQ